MFCLGPVSAWKMWLMSLHHRKLAPEGCACSVQGLSYCSTIRDHGSMDIWAYQTVTIQNHGRFGLQLPVEKWEYQRQNTMHPAGWKCRHTLYILFVWNLKVFHLFICVITCIHKVKPDLSTKCQTPKILRLICNTTT